MTYFEGRIQDQEIVIARRGNILDGKKKQTLYVGFYPYGGDYLTYNSLFNVGYSMDTILNHFIMNSGRSRNFYTFEFEQVFKTVLTKAIDEFKKEVDNDYSLDGWIGMLIIEPITRKLKYFFDWIRK